MSNNKSVYRDHENADYEIVRSFLATQSGRCTLDEDHKIARGDKIAKIQYADNPYVPIPGYACKHCIKFLPRAVL